MNLTADTIKPVEGMYAYVPNKPHLHNVVAGDVLVAGQVVKQDTDPTKPCFKKTETRLVIRQYRSR